MSLHDPISDFLTRIRNAMMAEHRYVDMAYSKLLASMAKVLKEQGFIENYLVDEAKRKMRIFLKYTAERESVIRGLKRISTPGLRRYVAWQKIPRVLGGFGIAIVSTSRGVIDGESARREKVGGELLCTIW